MIWIILILPGLICAYVMLLRPFMRKIPALQKFYADADGFWQTLWAYCGNSATIAAHFVLGGIGSMVALMDPIARALGDQDLKDQISSVTAHLDPKVAGGVMIAISMVTIVARLRSISKG